MGSVVEVDTEYMEAHFEMRGRRFHRRRFVKLLREVLAELHLLGVITHVTLCYPDRGRAELYREVGSAPDSPNVSVDLYPARYLERALLTHEFGHEADRRDPSFGWTPAVDVPCCDELYDFFNLAWNISLDSRLASRGLSKERRRSEFDHVVGPRHAALFEAAWTKPPGTHATIIELAKQLQILSA